MSALIYLVLVLASFLFLVPSFCSSAPIILHGIRRRDLPLYTGDNFRCRDGSQTIPISHVNDDFCDCADGSDEPSTSACATSTFFCRNVGARATAVFASRVNDGICDCCDGSDEWARGGCSNTCVEQGRKENEERIESLARMENGLKARESSLEESRIKLAELNEKKEKYTKTLKERTAVAEELKEKLDKEEAVEREENDRRRKIKEEEAAAAAAAAPAGNGAEATPGQEGQPAADAASVEPSASTPPPPPAPPATPPTTPRIIPRPTIPPHVITGDDDDDDVDTVAEGEQPRRRGSRFSRRSGRKGKQNAVPPSATPPPPAPPANEKVVEAEVSAFPYPAEYAYVAGGQQGGDEQKSSEPVVVDEEGEDDDDDDDDDQPEDIAAPPAEGGEAKDGEYISEAAQQARIAYDAAAKKQGRTQSKLDDVEAVLKNDFGPSSQFYPLYKNCYSLQAKQYTYEMCPYDSAKQKEGHAATSLGSWTGLAVKEEAGQRKYVFQFANGQGCWQGPQRSLDVQLACGETNLVLSVEEPSKCVYLMKFETPAVCDKQEVEQLRKQLEERMKSGDEDD